MDIAAMWERIFANPMASASAIDRVVHHAVILEFDVPGYRTDAAQQRGQSEDVGSPVGRRQVGHRDAGRINLRLESCVRTG